MRDAARTGVDSHLASLGPRALHRFPFTELFPPTSFMSDGDHVKCRTFACYKDEDYKTIGGKGKIMNTDVFSCSALSVPDMLRAKQARAQPADSSPKGLCLRPP